MKLEVGLISGIVLTIGFFALGLAARIGAWRGFVWAYRNNDLPLMLRNSVFAFIPVGLAFLSALIGGLLPKTQANRPIALALFVAFPLLMAVGFVIAHRPPGLFKPRWLREEEAQLAQPGSKPTWFDYFVFAGTAGAAVVGLVILLLLLTLSERTR